MGRLQGYHNDTEPVLARYDAIAYRIDANQEIEKVWADIESVLLTVTGVQAPVVEQVVEQVAYTTVSSAPVTYIIAQPMSYSNGVTYSSTTPYTTTTPYTYSTGGYTTTLAAAPSMRSFVGAAAPYTYLVGGVTYKMPSAIGSGIIDPVPITTATTTPAEAAADTATTTAATKAVKAKKVSKKRKGCC